MTFFVNGLLESIRSTVAKYRESIPRDELTYQELVCHAKDEGDAHRARFAGLRVIRATRKITSQRGGNNPTRSVHILEDNPTSIEDDGINEEDIFIIPEESVATTDLPTTVGSGQAEEQCLVTGVQHTPAASIAYGENQSTSNRVGWVDRQQTPKQRLVCWQCYAFDHTVPRCDTKVTDILSVVKNYEELSTSDKNRVPNTSYNAAKRFIEILESDKFKNDLKKEVGENHSQSKN